ncbi:MAG TPA: ferredoxin [Candidatus Omnitrophica bacterium]|nr:ferredoxin [Candidatus Omnitrophota bacterium]
MNKHTVTFYPDNKKVEVESATTILSAAISAHIHLNSACGGDGVCGRCKVIVKSGTVHSEPSGKVTSEERKRGVYLACQALVESDIEVEIPLESRLDMGSLSKEELESRLRNVYTKAEDISEAKPSLGEGLFTHAPLVVKFCLELPKPNFDDKISDLERVYRAIEEKIGERPIQTGLSNIRHLGELLRASDWKITVAVSQRGPVAEILSIQPGDACGRNYGLAFDIGTTTISGQLVDLDKKEILGTKAAYNRQASFGSDVISRIIYSKAQDGLEKLQNAVVDVINEMAEEFSEEHGIDLNDVTVVNVAGNTTMIHLLLRVDPTYIRQEPYVPTANYFPHFKAAEAGIKINPHGLLFCVSGVASYVGGDITAGVVACGVHESKELSLLIDIGTNGEIALGSREWIISCAASAGPAFEGSGMSCGLRATRGAIQEVRIEPKSLEVKYATLGDDKPRGICGSGYIDLVCELLKHGIMDKSGKLNRDIKNRRLREGKADYEFVVAFEEESGIDGDIVVTDSDLDNLKRAKAAVYSGIAILVRHMGTGLDQIKRIFIAGGFGTSLDIESAVSIGLIPDLPREKYIFVGNSSLAGSRQALLSCQASAICDKVAADITYFELSTDPEYMDEYMAALFFPHTDAKRFPSVKYV